MTRYECDFCGKQFSSEKGLEKISIVTGVSVSKAEDICAECMGEFERLVKDMKVRRHEETHTVEHEQGEASIWEIENNTNKGN